MNSFNQKSYKYLTRFLFPYRFWWRKVHLVWGTAMAPALLHLLSMLRVPGGCRLLSRARWDPLSQLQQQPIEPPSTHLTFPYTYIRLYFTLLCPHLRTSRLNWRPCWHCCEITANYPLTKWSQLHQNTTTGKNTGWTRLLKDAPKIAVETWKPCKVESLL